MKYLDTETKFMRFKGDIDQMLQNQSLRERINPVASKMNANLS